MMDVNIIMKMSAAALLPVAASLLLYAAISATGFGKKSVRFQQTVIGLIFGLIAVFGTEFGITVSGATVNVRDAAPLCAGLIFGAPAGLIAGFIGGAERWFAVFWGAGMYTRTACTIATAVAGIFAAVLRKNMFDDKIPGWQYGLAGGLVCEVLHMLLIFITNMNDVRHAFTVVKICSLPMILFNGLSVMTAIIAVTACAKRPLWTRGQKLSQTFARWLLICISIAFVFTGIFTFVVQTRLSNGDADNMLSLNLREVKTDITDISDANLLRKARIISGRIDTLSGKVDDEYLRSLSKTYEIAEIDVVGEDGIITRSTNDSFVGYDMSSGSQSAAFLVLLNGTEEFVQSYQPISYDSSISRKYGGAALNSGGFVQVGYDTDQFQKEIDSEMVGLTRNRHVGKNGSMIIADANWNVVSHTKGDDGQNSAYTGIRIDTASIPENTRFYADADGKPSYCMYTVDEGYYIIGTYPVEDVVFARDMSVYVAVFMEIIVFAVMFVLIYFLIKKLVVDNIGKVNEALGQITDGNLDTQVNVRTNEEFTSLSNDINITVGTLKRYIKEASERIDRELEFAKTIQHSSLPSVFPPFPDNHKFDIYADMFTAKEVGGDFYDFYFVNDNSFNFLIADVSGKGIPAAMFMMRAKTQIKSLSNSGIDLDEVFTRANAELCSNNSGQMFVTAWMGQLNPETGDLVCTNAGHNPPLIKRKDGGFEFFRTRPGLVLAGMPGIRYRKFETKLEPGDEIFLYTDGVTEATDKNNELFGDQRLLSALNRYRDLDVTSLVAAVKKEVDAFVGEAPQFDDITMLAVKYNGTECSVRKGTGVAPTEEIMNMVEDSLRKQKCPEKVISRVMIATDEIWANILNYSKATEAAAEACFKDGTAVVTFTDNGTPFNPLEKQDPDTTQSAADRAIGGLGIFMVKKMMTKVEYEYRNGNVMTIYCSEK